MAVKSTNTAGKPVKRRNDRTVKYEPIEHKSDNEVNEDIVDDSDTDLESSDSDNSDLNDDLQISEQLDIDDSISDNDVHDNDNDDNESDTELNDFITEQQNNIDTTSNASSSDSDDIDDTIDLTQYTATADKPRKLYYSDKGEYGNDTILDARKHDRTHSNIADLSDSDTEANITGNELQYKNRIGNIPIEWYDTMQHIGYDISGTKIGRKVAGDSIDAFLAGIGGNNPNFDRTVYDAVNDTHVVLNDSELAIINQIRKHRYPNVNYNDSEDMVEFYTSQIRHESLKSNVLPKSSFIPSKHEARTVRRLVHAIRNGWIKTTEQREQERIEMLAKRNDVYAIWSNDDSVIDPANKLHRQPTTYNAPKPILPTHAESYNPPSEYIPSEDELQRWNVLSDKDKPYNYIPHKYTTMRHIPAYNKLLNERFERCLDLYLAPRIRRAKLNMDPQSLIPKLPKPNELRPFPTELSITYTHSTKHYIRSIAVSSDSQWLCTACDNGTVKLYEISTGRCYKTWKFTNKHDTTQCIIEQVAFNPIHPIVAVIVEQYVFLLCTHTGSDAENIQCMNKLFQPIQQQLIENTELTKKQVNVLKLVSWRVTRETADSAITIESVPTKKQYTDTDDTDINKTLDNDVTDTDIKNLTGVERTVLLRITVGKRVKHIAWHNKGDYFSTVHNIDMNISTVLIHKLSQHTTQIPFKKSHGLIVRTEFHVHLPMFYVVTRTQVKVYNLASQALVKNFTSSSKHLSSLSLHPKGNYFILGSYDKRVLIYDMDSSTLPYKTLKYHSKAVRSVAYHPKYPLFATASDDGTIHIFHCTVYDDLITQPLIVPLKIIHAHTPSTVTGNFGVLCVQWHKTQPWLFSSGADGTIKLWTC